MTKLQLIVVSIAIGLVFVQIVQNSKDKQSGKIVKRQIGPLGIVAKLIGPAIQQWWISRNQGHGQGQGTGKVKFFLFPNSDDEDYAEEIILGDEHSLKSSHFNPGLPVILLLHGILGNSHILTDVQLLKNGCKLRIKHIYLHYNANIIIADYGQFAGTRFPFWLQPLNGILSVAASSNLEGIAERVASFIYFLKYSGAIGGPKNIHIVGHSAGCHVAGKAGRIVGLTMKSKIKRISGLDCLLGQVSSTSLNRDDATFVDVTHTSFGFSGILKPIGHVDFYLNGATFAQSNCPNLYPFTDPYCTHVSSVFYFAKSIRNKNIIGCYSRPSKCAERTRYGQFVSKRARGSFYVDIPQSRNY